MDQVFNLSDHKLLDNPFKAWLFGSKLSIDHHLLHVQVKYTRDHLWQGQTICGNHSTIRGLRGPSMVTKVALQCKYWGPAIFTSALGSNYKSIVVVRQVGMQTKFLQLTKFLILVNFNSKARLGCLDGLVVFTVSYR